MHIQSLWFVFSGLTTEVRSNFTDPPAQKKTQLFDCPVARPLHRRGECKYLKIFKIAETCKMESPPLGF
jgi:hypothetical protein